jgi:GNAT superfamily N-acetyltransferase
LDNIKIIDLKKDKSFIAPYVDLRNRYIELLLTNAVTVTETKEWLTNKDVEVRCVIEDNILIGAVILYLKRKGEIAIFVKDQKRGIGTELLKVIEKVAKEKNLNSIWAWVLKDNFIAQRVFEKNGFVKEGTNEREYKAIIKHGIKYKKNLDY